MQKRLSQVCLKIFDVKFLPGRQCRCSPFLGGDYYTRAAERGKMNIPLSSYAPEKLVSRDGFSRPRPASACSFSIRRLNLVLTNFQLSVNADSGVPYSTFGNFGPPGCDSDVVPTRT